MSNANRTNNPFRPADNRLPNIPQTVGGTYGERMKYQKVSQGTPAATRPASAPIDQFKKSGVDASQFAANDTYKQARRSTAGAPYKPAILNSFENGSIPQVKKAGVPSDAAILNFLDKVIAAAKK
jgi:hypothetical protein